MAKPPKKPKPEEEIETHPDAWERFQRTMDKIVLPKRRGPREDKEGEQK